MAKRSADIGVTENLPQKVVALLGRDIESGVLEPGSRLPTEQQLASRLGVSRNVIREAIAQLRADGLVEARQGVGAFVMAPEHPLVASIVTWTVFVAKIVEQHRTRKVVVFKYRRRKGYRVKRGHRQHYTALRIEDIKV